MPDCVLGPFTYVCCKNVCQASLPLFLTWVSLTMFCLKKCEMEFIFSAQHLLLLLVGEITHWCMNFEWWQLLSYMQIQHITPNILHWSLWKRPISPVMSGKLFSCAIAHSYPPPPPSFCYWWLIMKKHGLALTVALTLTLRGVQKCNSV